MPRPLYNEEEVDHNNMLIHDELRYNRRSLLEEHQQLLINLIVEQKLVYDKIMRAVNEAKGGFFFLYGYGETGKILFGRLSLLTKLIIWDNAKYCFEDLDQTLRDILRFKDTSNADKPFGGKTFVLGGDFGQILHVIAKGSRQDIVNATLNSSYLWTHCEVLNLSKNMRLQRDQLDAHLDELKSFSEWILAISDGRTGSSIDGIEKVQIPDDFLINNCDDPISPIVESTYPDFFNHSSDIDCLQQRAILAPTLDMVESINEYMVSLNHSPEKTYLSSDTVGVPMMLLRNIDRSSGLCNGTRLIITRLGNQVIEAKVLSDSMDDNKMISSTKIPVKRTREDNGSSLVEVDDDVAQLSSNKIKRVIKQEKKSMNDCIYFILNDFIEAIA
ncbi:uncharacterized protein [Nicotiana sylvestris]|uniref:uncharacterized protein n=1 Tax=Nicotiana sylvestris TaxID=4096 RepID=UPI00388C9D14